MTDKELNDLVKNIYKNLRTTSIQTLVDGPTELDVIGKNDESTEETYKPFYIVSTFLCGRCAGLSIVSEEGLRRLSKSNYHDAELFDRMMKTIGFCNIDEYISTYSGKFNNNAVYVEGFSRRITLQEPLLSEYGPYIIYYTDMASLRGLSRILFHESEFSGEYDIPSMIVYPTVAEIEKTAGQTIKNTDMLWFCRDWKE